MDMGKNDYRINWRKESVRRFEFYIIKDNKKLLEWFESVPSKQALILELLEKEMRKQKRKEKNAKEVQKD